MKLARCLAAFALALLPACTTIYQVAPIDSPLVDPYSTNAIIVRDQVRRIAEMIETFAVDYNRYPKPDGRGTVIAGERFVPVRSLERDLSPYRSPVSAVDPWGRPILYWTDEQAQNYILISSGCDDRVDHEAIRQAIAFAKGRQVFLDGKPSTCLEDEIIFSNGSFLAYPQPSARPCQPVRVE